MSSVRDGFARERAGSLVNRAREWVLLDGPRSVVAGLFVAGLGALVALTSAAGLVPLDRLMSVYYVFGGLIGGNLTIITVVVSINQLLLSRELSTPGELRSEIEGVVDYRNDVEDTADRIAPVEPLGFLRLLFEETRRKAQQLAGIALNEADRNVAEELDPVVTELTEHVDRVDELLQASSASTFDVLSVTLNTNYARDIHALRRVERRHGETLPDDVDDAIDELVDLLHDVDVARQYFKSIYLQQELASLSRALLYVGVPAVAVVALAQFTFTASRGTSVPRPYLSVVVPAVLVVGLVPLAVLSAFVLRISTVSQRTAAVVPFTTPEQEK